MIDNFITGLMRLVGGTMYFSGMGMLGYAVIGGYYHYSPVWHAVAWGVAGWILFWNGQNLLGEYKPQNAPALPVQVHQPPPQPVSPYPRVARNAPRPPPRKVQSDWD